MTNPTPNNDNAMMKRLDEIETGLKVQLETKDSQIKELTDKINTLSKNSNKRSIDDEVVDTARRSADKMSLPVINGVPIVKGEVKRYIGVKGIESVMMATDAKGDRKSVV